jgi:NAD(P)-dependent dehydrogenase (short-subunit alcohol dehydrogenase family)
VVGASSGIGRALAKASAGTGWKVALAARRADLLHEAVSEIDVAVSPGSAFSLTCDVADPAQSEELAGRAARLLGGLDAVVYSAGAALLGPVSSTSAEAWQTMLSTNLVGAALVTAGALEHLRESAARPTVAYLSTHSVSPPWPGIVGYVASKAALDALARGLRVEEPWLRVLDVTLGDTATGFADAWDPAAASAAIERWLSDGYMTHRVLSAEEAAAAVLEAIESEDAPDDLLVRGEPVTP